MVCDKNLIKIEEKKLEYGQKFVENYERLQGEQEWKEKKHLAINEAIMQSGKVIEVEKHVYIFT